LLRFLAVAMAGREEKLKKQVHASNAGDKRGRRAHDQARWWLSIGCRSPFLSSCDQFLACPSIPLPCLCILHPLDAASYRHGQPTNRKKIDSTLDRHTRIKTETHNVAPLKEKHGQRPFLICRDADARIWHQEGTDRLPALNQSSGSSRMASATGINDS